MTDKKIEWKIINDQEWCVDECGNKNRVSYYGSKEAAEKALRSLKNCSDCSNCSNCSNCSYCSDCSYCSNCSDCSNCSNCSNCSYCSYCSNCSNCSYCSNRYRYHNKKDSEALNELVIPKIENIHQKIYEAASKKGALNMGSWHTCETTHCRAGWVVFLAGEDGKKLEQRFRSALAASMIYRASSDIQVRMPEFYKNNEEALESMRKAAEEEKSKNK